MRQEPYRHSRHKDQIGWSKALTGDELNQLADYLCGRRPDAVTGELFDKDTIEGARLKTMVDLLLCTGLRVTEMAFLRLQDCPAVLGEDVIEVYRGKGNKSRTVPLAKAMREELDDYINRTRPKTLPRWVNKTDIKRQVFYNLQKTTFLQTVKEPKDTAIARRSSTTLYRMLRKMGLAAGLSKPVRPHMFRHTFIYKALKDGVDIYHLAFIVGHSSIETTAKYLHLVNAALIGAGERCNYGTK